MLPGAFTKEALSATYFRLWRAAKRVELHNHKPILCLKPSLGHMG